MSIPLAKYFSLFIIISQCTHQESISACISPDFHPGRSACRTKILRPKSADLLRIPFSRFKVGAPPQIIIITRWTGRGTSFTGVFAAIHVAYPRFRLLFPDTSFPSQRLSLCLPGRPPPTTHIYYKCQCTGSDTSMLSLFPPDDIGEPAPHAPPPGTFSFFSFQSLSPPIAAVFSSVHPHNPQHRPKPLPDRMNSRSS